MPIERHEEPGQNKEILRKKEALITLQKETIKVAAAWCEDYWSDWFIKLGFPFKPATIIFLDDSSTAKDGKLENEGAWFNPKDKHIYFNLDARLELFKFVGGGELPAEETIQAITAGTVFHEYTHYIQNMLELGYGHTLTREHDLPPLEDQADYFTGILFKYVQDMHRDAELNDHDNDAIYNWLERIGSDSLIRLANDELVRRGLTFRYPEVTSDGPLTSKRTDGGHASGLVRAGGFAIGYHGGDFKTGFIEYIKKRGIHSRNPQIQIQLMALGLL